MCSFEEFESFIESVRLDPRVQRLLTEVREIYEREASRVPFHGWKHVDFVVNGILRFGEDLGADLPVAVVSGLVHDVNYLVERGEREEAGAGYRASILEKVGYTPTEVQQVESIVIEARTRTRPATISREAMALSDADTAFKSLPTTPLLSVYYMYETGSDLSDLARKVVEEQAPLEDGGIYFYSAAARSLYAEDARFNLDVWSRVLFSLDREDVQRAL